MSSLWNLVRVRTSTSGAGTVTLGAAVSGFLTADQAGVTDGAVVGYSLRDGVNSETGYGTYTLATLKLTRNVRKSTNSNLAISLSGSAEVIFTPSAEDLAVLGTANELTATVGTNGTTLSLPTALTFTGKTVTGGTFAAMTALGIRSTGSAFDLQVVSAEVLTASRALTLKLNDVARTVDLGGNLTLAGALSTVGAFATTLTMTGATGVTLPTTGTLATLAGSEALTNKTIGNTNTVTLKDTLFTVQDDGDATKLFALQLSGITTGNTRTWTVPDSSDTIVGLAATQELTNKTLNASVGKGVWTASGTWTLPAHTLAGTVSGGGQQLNNIIIGTSTPLAGFFTTLAASTSATVTSASAVALAVGLAGATNPAFAVDASTASQAAGFKVTGAATGGTVALVATDSGSNTNLTINAKGSGTIGIGSVSTGAVTITPALTLSAALTYGGVTLTNNVTGTGKMVLDTSPVLANPTLGVQQTTQGSLILANTAAGAFATTLKSSNSASAAYTLTFPTTAGSADQLLSTNGSGVLSWVTVAGAGTVTSVAATNGVVSSTGSAITGSGTIYGGPLGAGGRLTLTTLTPVLTATVSGATTLYYTTYIHNLIPIYDGTVVRSYTFAELSLVLGSNWGATTNFDVYLGNDSGTFRLCSVAWTNATTRATALNLAQNGFYSNNASFTARYNNTTTFTCPQYQGTYLGTFRTNGSTGQIDFIYGAVAAGGTAGSLGIWNAYNRVPWSMMVGDTTDSWTNSTTSWVAANASATMRISYVCGLNEDMISACYYATGSTTTLAPRASVGYDATNALPATATTGCSGVATRIAMPGAYSGPAGLGFHFVSAIEFGNTGASFYGDNGNVGSEQSGLVVNGMY